MQSPAQPASISAFHALPAYYGYRADDAEMPYAHFLQSEDHVRAAQIGMAHRSPVPPQTITPFAEVAASLSSPGYLAHETGWCGLAGGACAVAVYTAMPGVRAAMWDWWFAWHGSESARYKLWAPAAHLAAFWKDGAGDAAGAKSYIGRTSLIKETIGSVYLEGAIRFVEPASIGFMPGAFDGTVICGRAGEVDAPIEHTWLIHQVRNTPDGCEMRSRFYLGQDPMLTTTGATLPPPAPDRPRPGPIPVELLEHCATEMHHLAGFLPELYAAFGPAAL